jgi:hypothetical protein
LAREIERRQPLAAGEQRRNYRQERRRTLGGNSRPPSRRQRRSVSASSSIAEWVTDAPSTASASNEIKQQAPARPSADFCHKPNMTPPWNYDSGERLFHRTPPWGQCLKGFQRDE